MAGMEVIVKAFRVLLMLLCGTVVTMPAQAQAPCGNRGEIIKMLAEKYREMPRAMAIAKETSLLEIFTSKSGSWTILVTQPTGPSCIIGAGQSWEDIPLQAELTGL
jgi:hypothetical protein